MHMPADKKTTAFAVLACMGLVAACGGSPANSTKRTTSADTTGSCSVTYDVYSDSDGNTCTVTTASSDDCCGISSSDGCDGIDLSEWDGPSSSTDDYDDTCNGQTSGDNGGGDNGGGDNGGGDNGGGGNTDNGSSSSNTSASPDGNCSVTLYTYTSPPPGRYLTCSWYVASPNPCCGTSTEPRCPIDAFPAYSDETTTRYDADCNPM
jgi:hypothetical protein